MVLLSRFLTSSVTQFSQSLGSGCIAWFWICEQEHSQVCVCSKAFAPTNSSARNSFPQMPRWHPPEFLSGFCSNVTLSVKLFLTSLYKYQSPPTPGGLSIPFPLLPISPQHLFIPPTSPQKTRKVPFSLISSFRGNCVTQWQKLYSSTNFDGSSMMKFTMYTFLFNLDHSSEKTGNQEIVIVSRSKQRIY